MHSQDVPISAVSLRFTFSHRLTFFSDFIKQFGFSELIYGVLIKQKARPINAMGSKSK